MRFKMASAGAAKDYGPLVGAVDQGTSSSRFLVSMDAVQMCYWSINGGGLLIGTHFIGILKNTFKQ